MRIVFLRLILIVATATLAACASYSGSSLQAGVATEADVIALMGEPAMRWQEADGTRQLAYPRGPTGTQTFMAFIGSDGRLMRIEKVLDEARLAQLVRGKSTKDEVLKLLGPPQPHWTVYFKARDELVWTWHFCDSHSESAFLDVLFDGTTGLVRTTYQRPDLGGFDGIAPSCGH